jgi:hypothetical protein
MNTKTKREVKSKAQLEAQMKQIEKNKKSNQFVKEVFFPKLLQNQKNVEDAQLMLAVLEMAIQQGFVNLQKTTLVSSLELGVIDEQYKEFKEILEIFKDQTVEDAIYQFTSMKTAIQTAVIDEMRDRKLESLKTLERLSIKE